MKIERAEIKRLLHAARVTLDYQTKRAKNSTPERIASLRTEVERLAELYADSDPARCTLRVRSPYFIGPRMKRGKRGDGPTIICFRCQEEKPIDQYYAKGTVCIACMVKRSAEWAAKNPEKSKHCKRVYNEANREAHKAKARERYWSDPEAARERSRASYDPDRSNEYQKKYLSRRRKEDPAFRAFLNCKARMHRLMESAGVKKRTRSAELIGMQRDEFLSYLRSLWTEGMTWENYGWGEGKWVIDHIIPAAFFNHAIIGQQKQCWHYTNLRPMWWRKNLQKSDRLPCGKRARDKKSLDEVAA